MIANVDDTIKWLRLINAEFWEVKVKDGENSNVFVCNKELCFEDNVRRFRDVMSLSSGGRYRVIAKQNSSANKGNFYEEFSNLPTNAPAVGNIQSVASGIPEERVAVLIQEALEKERAARETENLKNIIKELQIENKNLNGPVNRIAQRLEPFIVPALNGIAQKFFKGSQIAIAGTENTNQVINENHIEEMDEEKLKEIQDRIQIAVEQWSEADSEFVEVIEFLAKFAASGEPIQTGFVSLTYTQVKDMILKK